MQESLSCVPGVDGKIHPSGFVQQGDDSASLVTAYAALRLQDRFPHPHKEHMKDTYNIFVTRTLLSLLCILGVEIAGNKECLCSFQLIYRFQKFQDTDLLSFCCFHLICVINSKIFFMTTVTLISLPL